MSAVWVGVPAHPPESSMSEGAVPNLTNGREINPRRERAHSKRRSAGPAIPCFLSFPM